MLTLWIYVDIPPVSFLQRLRDAIDFSSFWSGLIKAPFMALIIALIACTEGMAVRGSAEVARHAHHRLRREVDLHGDRGRRHLRHLLRGDRLLMATNGSGDPIIRVRGLTVGFGGTTVLENLDIDVRPGEILAIVGASGTGKSVLLRSILGLVQPQAGRSRRSARRSGRTARRSRWKSAGACSSSSARSSPR